MPEKPDSKRSDTSELIKELEHHLAQAKLQERFEKQAKEHKENLEKQLDRTMKVLYAVAAIIAGGASFFGFKTYFDASERLKFDVSQRIEKLIDREFVTQERDKRIADYKRGAVVGYYATRASDSVFAKDKLPEQDILTVLEILDRPDSPYFRDALRVIRSFDSFRKEYASRFSKKLTEIFVRITKESGSGIPSDSQVFLVEAIGALRDKDAYKPFLEAATGNALPGEVRNAVLKALPAVCPEEKQKATAEALLKSGVDLRKQNLNAYLLLLETALRLDFRTALPEATTLAKSGTSDEVEKFPTLFEILIPKRGYYASEEDARAKVESSIKDFLTNRLVRGLDLDTMNRFRGRTFNSLGQMPEEPRLILWIRTGGGSASGAGFSQDVLFTPIFLHAIKETVTELSDTNRVGFLKDWVQPMIEFGAKRFEYEKLIGKIGSNADESVWRDRFTVKALSVNQSNVVWQIVSFRGTNALVKAKSPSKVADVIDGRSLSFDEIDWTSLSWEGRSYSTRKEDLDW